MYKLRVIRPPVKERSEVDVLLCLQGIPMGSTECYSIHYSIKLYFYLIVSEDYYDHPSSP